MPKKKDKKKKSKNNQKNLKTKKSKKVGKPLSWKRTSQDGTKHEIICNPESKTITISQEDPGPRLDGGGASYTFVQFSRNDAVRNMINNTFGSQAKRIITQVEECVSNSDWRL